MRFSVDVTWYTAEEWRKVKDTAVDPERFEETYEEWVKMVDEAIQEIRERGVTVQKQCVVSSELLAWCLAHGRVNDAKARAEFIVAADRSSGDGA